MGAYLIGLLYLYSTITSILFNNIFFKSFKIWGRLIINLSNSSLLISNYTIISSFIKLTPLMIQRKI
jgi:hypothetical protein